MSLPDRAYGERQQASPIRIHGVVTEVTCEPHRCRVAIRIESVDRNVSTRPLNKGDTITVLVVPTGASSGALPRTGFQAPPIGLPDNSVRIPPVSSHTQAWIRPAEVGTSEAQAQLYELMAGPFGFGPNLEDQSPL